MSIEEQAIAVSVKAGAISLKVLLSAIRALVSSRNHVKHGNQSLRKLNLQNRQLESVPLPGPDFESFRQQLKKYSVDFSAYKDKGSGEYTVFFKAQDVDRVEQGLKNAVKDYDKIPIRKKPVRDVMDDAVKRAAEREAGRNGQEHEHSAAKEAER